MTDVRTNVPQFHRRGTVAYTADDVEWQAYAACNGEDPEKWFPAEAGHQSQIEVQKAVEVCLTCPLIARQGCARLALDQRSQYGVWAGVHLGTNPKARAQARWKLRAIAGQQEQEAN